MTPQDVLPSLVHDRLAGKRIDVVGFTDHLLVLAGDVGEIRCAPVDEDRLRFTLPAEASFDVPLDHARGKLRMVCARLAVVSAGAGELTPYGGQGTVPLTRTAELNDGQPSKTRRTVNVQFTNTASEVGFTLRGEGYPGGVARAASRDNMHA